MTTMDTILGALLGAPSLPGARCRGKPHLFDPPGDREPPEVVSARHAQALLLCRGCVALPDCSRWLSGLTPAKRPTGVVAGRIITPPRRKASQ